MKIFLFLLLAAFLQLGNGSKTKTKVRKNRLVSLAKCTLALMFISTLSSDTTELQCPSKLPPNAELIMNHIRCSAEQPSFYEKYLTNEQQNCGLLSSLFNKVQAIGKCRSQTSKIIYDGAKTRILGEELSNEKQQDMMHSWLKTLGLNDHAVARYLNVFARKKNLDFFQVQRAQEFFSEQGRYSPEESVKKALRKECANLDFNQVSRMMPYARLLHNDSHDENNLALETALVRKYQELDFDKVDQLAKIIDAVNPDAPYWTAKCALDQKYQNYEFDKVKLMIPFTNALKPFYQGTSISTEHLIRKVLLNPKYQSTNFDKVHALKTKIAKITEDDKWAAKFALDEKYHNYDFKKIDQMITYANQMKPFYLGYDDELIEKVLLNKKYQRVDFDKVRELEAKIKKVNPDQPRWTARFALEEKYQSYDFAKIDRMIPYANALKPFHTSGSRVHYEDLIPKVLLRKTYQKLDFDKVDALKERLNAINPDEITRMTSRTAKIAINYENYKSKKIEDAMILFQKIFKNGSFSYLQATETWVQKTSLSKIKEMIEEAKKLSIERIQNEFTLEKEWKKLMTTLQVKKDDL